VIKCLANNHLKDGSALISKNPAVPAVEDAIEIVVCELNPALLATEEDTTLGPP